MAAQLFRVQLGRPLTRRAFVALTFFNIFFTATTAAFIALWARKAELSPALNTFTRHVLVQGHLATENVIAAWYSSMLLLVTAGAALLAFAADKRAGAWALRVGWLLFAAVFALLSLDEIGSFHERVGMLTHAATANKSLGWAYLLAVPIGAVGLFMLAFGWFHVRRVRATFVLFAAGVGLFMLNPVLEAIEMAMIHGAGATQGTWQRSLHDLLLVLEEGGLELFGILCFLAAVVMYVRTRAGDVSVWPASTRHLAWSVRALTLLALAGITAVDRVIARLPPGDTGVPEHWFPAAALLLVAVIAATLVRSDPARGSSMLIAVSIALSAFFGAGLHAYPTWHSYDDWRVMLNASLAVVFGIGLWESCGRSRPLLTMAAALLMTAATNIPGEMATFLAVGAAGVAVEGMLSGGELIPTAKGAEAALEAGVRA